MKALALVRICWAFIVLLPALVKPSTIEETLAAPVYPTVTFNLDQPTKYSASVTSLRTQLIVAGSVACNIPVTPSRRTISVAQRYVLVGLRTTEKETATVLTFTLALDVTSAYVVAYRDNNGAAYFFKGIDDYAVAKANLFTEGTQTDLTFGESYQSMETAAKADRDQIPLGVLQLGKAIIELNKNNNVVKNQAKFLLIAIQMVSEAARFQYIVNKIVVQGDNGYKPDPKAISLETNWSKLSKAVQKSDVAPTGRCTKINPAIELRNADGSIWVVDTVDKIRNDMKIMKYDEDQQSTWSISYFTQIISSIYGAFAIVE